MEGMKFHGYGIVDRNGSPSAYLGKNLNHAEEHVEWMSKEWPLSAPFRVVELFYKEDQ